MFERTLAYAHTSTTSARSNIRLVCTGERVVDWCTLEQGGEVGELVELVDCCAPEQGRWWTVVRSSRVSGGLVCI